MGKAIKNPKLLKFLYLIASIMFIIPSMNYLWNNKTILGFNKWFNFLLDNSTAENQTFWYVIILILITVLFYLIVKNRDKLFKNIKSILVYTAIIGAIYIFAIPFTCSDVFYYMGIGRLDAEYNQNPYYTTIKDFVDENNIPDMENDKVIKQGYLNYWSDTTVVYGPVWQLICKCMSILSFGNVDIGLLIFKLINLVIHIINCYLIYKLSGRKIFSILYGLNPFMLIEGIMCAHNDIFVIFFILLALYFMLKKKKLAISMVFLACATGIKYFSILLLPFIIIYFYRNEKPLKRFIRCIQYGSIFALALVIPYLLYIKDFSILQGMATQQDKVAKSIYIPIMQYFPQVNIPTLSKFFLEVFAIIYFFACIIMLNEKNLSFRKCIQKYNKFLLVFIFILITQFQPWYLIWLMPTFMWLEPNMVKLITSVGIIAEFSNSVFLLETESYENGTPFIFILYISILTVALILEKMSNKRKVKCFIK